MSNTPLTSQTVNYRQGRIERLLHELRYEIERGMMEGEIDEHLGFRFIVPSSKAIPGGMVMCEFRTKPSLRPFWAPDAPRLRIVK